MGAQGDTKQYRGDMGVQVKHRSQGESCEYRGIHRSTERCMGVQG